MSTLISKEKQNIPQGWISVCLDEICEVITKGSTPTTYGFLYQKKGINFVKVENIVNNWIDQKTITQFVSKEANDFLKRSQLKENDVLFSIAGTIGRTAIVRKEDLPANTNQALAIIRFPQNLLESRYIRTILNSPFLINMYAGKRRGVGMDNMSLGDLKELSIPIPPLNEQKRIVVKIEELFSRLEYGIKNLKKIKLELKQYRQSILMDAIMGKMTKNWRERNCNIESGKNLLKKIQLDRKRAHDEVCKKARTDGKRIPSEPDNMSDIKIRNFVELPSIPNNWTWCSVNSICSQITDGEHINPKYMTSGNLLLSAKNVQDGFVSYDDVSYINDEDFQNAIKRCKPELNDILITSTGTVGRVAIVKDNRPFAVLRSVLLLKPEYIHPEFLLRYLQSSFAFKEMTNASGSSIQAHLYIKDTKSMPFPLAPLEEQQEIVKEIANKFSFIGSMEKEIIKNLNQSDVLRQSILKYAFEGKLVPQDPNDESVSILLEKIKQKKAKLQEIQKVNKAKTFKLRRTKNVK